MALQIEMAVTAGARLNVPTSVPTALQSFLLQLTAFDPEERPSFDSITLALESISDLLRADKLGEVDGFKLPPG